MTSEINEQAIRDAISSRDLVILDSTTTPINNTPLPLIITIICEAHWNEGLVLIFNKMNEVLPRLFKVVEADILLRTILANYIEGVDIFINFGGDINSSNQDLITALHFACYDGLTDMVKTLLEHNADTQLRDEMGATPLQVAESRAAFDVIEILGRHEQ